MKKGFILLPILIIIILSLGLALFLFRDRLNVAFFTPRQTGKPLIQNGQVGSPIPQDLEVVAQNLEIPWEITFLPNGELLVTERSGKLLKVGQETKVISQISGVRHIGEGGLLGLALHPDFDTNNFIYLYFTSQAGGAITNRVERYQLRNDVLSDKKVILEGIKGSANHDGGRIAFGPDGYLYITTGDAQTPSLAQDKNSLNGKILRIRDDGSTPADNPFGNAVYSLGHRNPQGLAWDKSGGLWASEHGPSGAETGNDEINLITKGANYGWPTIRGGQTKEGMVTPVIESGTQDTWAPSGMAYWDGSLFFSGLRGEALYEAKILPGNQLSLVTHFKQEWGRVRAVSVGPDGHLYLSTSNRDGRGQVRPNDDQIIRIDPKIFR